MIRGNLKPEARLGCFSAMLSVGITAATFCYSMPAFAQQTPLTMDGKSILFQRVLTRPATQVWTAPGDVSQPAKDLPPFTPFYVYAKDQSKAEEWLQIGKDSVGSVAGWVPADSVIEWKHAISVAFTNPAGRERLPFFKSDADLESLISDEKVVPKTQEIIETLKSGLVGPDYVAIAIEPEGKIFTKENFYLLPILEFSDALSYDFLEVRMLKIASANEHEEIAPTAANPVVQSNASAANVPQSAPASQPVQVQPQALQSATAQQATATQPQPSQTPAAALTAQQQPAVQQQAAAPQPAQPQVQVQPTATVSQTAQQQPVTPQSQLQAPSQQATSQTSQVQTQVPQPAPIQPVVQPQPQGQQAAAVAAPAASTLASIAPQVASAVPSNLPKSGIAFVIDTTTSMGPYIESLRKVVRKLNDVLDKDGLLQDTSFAMIGYRDNTQVAPGLDYVSKIFANFKEGKTAEEFLTLAADVGAASASSQNFSEDVYAGVLDSISKLDWSPFLGRFVILIGDAGPRLGSDPLSETKLGAPQLVKLAREKNIRVMALHLKTPSGKNNHEQAEQEFLTLTEQENSDYLYYAVDAGDVREFDEVLEEASLTIADLINVVAFQPPVQAGANTAVPATTTNPTQGLATGGQAATPQQAAPQTASAVVPAQATTQLTPAPTQSQQTQAAPQPQQPAQSQQAPATAQAQQAPATPQAPAPQQQVATTVTPAVAAPAPPVDPKRAKFLKAIRDVGKAMRMEYLGRLRGDVPPSVFEAWVADRDLVNPKKKAIDVRLLLTKSQLSDLQEALKTIVREGQMGQIAPDEFFDRLKSASAALSTDPGRFNATQFQTIGDIDILSELLGDLPYKSKIMNITQRDWLSFSIGEQEEFVANLISKIRLYQEFHDDVDNWVDFDGELSASEALYPVPLDFLP